MSFLLGLLNWEHLGLQLPLIILWRAESRDELRQIPENILWIPGSSHVSKPVQCQTSRYWEPVNILHPLWDYFKWLLFSLRLQTQRIVLKTWPQRFCCFTFGNCLDLLVPFPHSGNIMELLAYARGMTTAADHDPYLFLTCPHLSWLVESLIIHSWPFP